MLHRLLQLIVAGAFLLASVLVPGWGVASAAASDDCDPLARPASEFVVIEPNDLEFKIEFDLAQNSVETVEASRTIAGFRLKNGGFSDDSVAEVMAYLDSLVAWYRYLADPCARALPYEGPYTNKPAGGGSPYGFGGIDVTAGPPVVITVTEPEGVASVEVGRVVVDAGPDLAHGGSESYALAYFGAGLLAFGASAMGMRRWMSGPIDPPMS